MTCQHCGREGGHGVRGMSRCPFEPGTAHRVVQDTIDFWAENAWREPRYFTSQKAYLKALDASGLMLKEKKPTHGRCLDAQTLANAERLVRRGSSEGIETRVLDETMTVEAEC